MVWQSHITGHEDHDGSTGKGSEKDIEFQP